MVVLGIDPGSYTTGFAVLEKAAGVRALRYGAICCKRTAKPEDRLLHIASELEKLLDEFKPDVLSMEGVFFAKNAKSALMLGQVRGAVLVTCRKRGLEFAEYSPRSVKLAVTGNGAASKEQVASFVATLLGIPQLEGPLDASDALAIAWTHASPPPLASLLPPKRKRRGDAMRELAIKMGAILP